MTSPIVDLVVETHYRVGLPKPILSEVTWRIEAGQHWALIGENGSGKSTLLAIVAGNLWPSRGTVRVLGTEYGKTDKRELRKHIGVVSSVLFSEFPDHDSALEIAASGLEARIGRLGPLTDEQIERASEALDSVSARSYSHKRYGVLSQGERQRVMIARALVNRPELLVLDEPCSGLDPVARERFLCDLGRLAQSGRAPTQLHVTHHIEEIPSFVTHALLLKQGGVLIQGRIEGVLTDDWLTRCFSVPCKVSRHSSGDTRRFGLELDRAFFE